MEEEKIFTTYEEYENFYFSKGDTESTRSDSRLPIAAVMAENAMEKHAGKLRNRLVQAEKS